MADVPRACILRHLSPAGEQVLSGNKVSMDIQNRNPRIHTLALLFELVAAEILLGDSECIDNQHNAGT